MDNDNGQVINGQSTEHETTTQENVAEDIKGNPAYIAMKEMLDTQTAQLRPQAGRVRQCLA